MWNNYDEKSIYSAFEAARIQGVNFIDTAQAYKGAEKLIGKIVKNLKWDDVIIGTKIAPKISPIYPVRANQAYPAEYIISETEKSLINLGVDQIPLLQLHTWDESWITENEWLETLIMLKKQGKIGSIGLSLIDHGADTAIEIVKSGYIDSIQVLYNLFDQSANNKLLDECLLNSVSVIARSVLYEGIFSGKIKPNHKFDDNDWRKDYFSGGHLEECLNRLELIYSDKVSLENILPYAIRFALSHPAITTAIIGMRSVSHVWENSKISDGLLLLPNELEELKSHSWLAL